MGYQLEFETTDLVTASELDAALFNVELYDGDLSRLAWCKVPGRGTLRAGEQGVTLLAINRAHEFVFVFRGDGVEVILNNKVGIFPSFAMLPARMKAPLKGVLLDLDGTCVKSEAFWIAVILEAVNRMRARLGMPPVGAFGDSELPHISGRTVPEHLLYCIQHYCPRATLGELQDLYTDIAEEYMQRLNAGELDIDAFEPAEGLKELLLMLRANDVKIGIVTSGLYYKAWPELKQAMDKLGLGDPTAFFDAILTSGTLAKKGSACGTMGNAIAKPWPNIYFEAAQVIGFTMDEREHYVGVGDSASDVGSLRLMGVPFIGVAHGNIEQGGTKCLCTDFVASLADVRDLLEKQLKN